MAQASKYSVETTISAEDFLIGLTSRGWFRRYSGSIITNIEDAIANERTERLAADQQLQQNIDTLDTYVQAEVSSLQSNINAEQNARIAADQTLQNNINIEESARINADNALALSIAEKNPLKFMTSVDDVKNMTTEEIISSKYIVVKEIGKGYIWDANAIGDGNTGDSFIVIRPNVIAPFQQGRFVYSFEFNQAKFAGIYYPGETIALAIGQSAIVAEPGTYIFVLTGTNTEITLPGSVIQEQSIIYCYYNSIIGVPTLRLIPFSGSGGSGTLPFSDAQIDAIIAADSPSQTNPFVTTNEVTAIETTLQNSIASEASQRSSADVSINSTLNFFRGEFRERIRYVQTLSELRAIDVAASNTNGYIVVAETHDGYRFDPNSLLPDNARGVIRPTSVSSSEPGRFIRIFKFNQSLIVDLAYNGRSSILMNPGESAIVFEGGNYTFRNQYTNISVSKSIPNASIVRMVQVTSSVWDVLIKPIERVPLTDNEVIALQSANNPSYTNPYATMNDISSGAVDTVQKPFTQSIPFDELTSWMTVSPSSTLVLTPDTTDAINGNRTFLTINPNSTYNVDFSAFTKSGGSLNFDNTKRNLIMFWKDGDIYWYRIFEQIDVLAGSGGDINIQNKIFPNAVGYGTNSRGAYAGTVDPQILIVDSLAAGVIGSGNRGTFKWACEQQFPRIIIFEVSGVIDLSADPDWRIQVDSPYINVYGQTAPGKGITIYGNVFWLQATDMLFQHIRFRMGDVRPSLAPNTADTISCYYGTSRVVFDHCSFSWSIDELVGTKDDNTDFTFSDCIFSEPLDISWHYDEGNLNPERHSYGCLMNTHNTTFVRNLFAYMGGRAPLVRNGYNQIINNLNYNGRWSSVMLENTSFDIFADVINNHTINIPYMGNLSSAGDRAAYIASILTAASRLYVSGNICRYKTLNPSATEWDTVFYNERATQALSPVTDLTDLNILPAENVYDYVLDHAGAFYWDRDNIDTEIINKIRTDVQGDFRHSATNRPAIARNEEAGTQATGNMSAGFNWATTPQNLVISYKRAGAFDPVGPLTLTLNQATVNADEVVTLLNTLLPSFLRARRIGNLAVQTYWIEIYATAFDADQYITIHPEGTAHTTLGIEAKTFNSILYTQVVNVSESRALVVPVSPHVDSDANSYTNLEEWAWDMLPHEAGNVVTPWLFGGGGLDLNANYSPVGDWNHIGELSKNGLPVATENWANGQFIPSSKTFMLSDILDAGSIAGWDIWEGTQTQYDALGTYDPTTLYFIDGSLMSADITAALEGAAAPSASNVFATIADITSSGGGDMLASVYDPTAIAASAFSMGNMIETTTAKILTDTERSNIAIAFGWGNHAGLYSLLNHNHSGVYEPANANIQTHISATTGNPHNVTATDVGLGSVNNTSDADKPVSTAQQAALDTKQPVLTQRTEATAFTLSAADVYVKIRYTGATDINVTVPSTLLSTCSILIRQAGAGVVTLVPDTGGTLNGNTKTAGQHSSILIEGVSANVFDVTGGVA